MSRGKLTPETQIARLKEQVADEQYENPMESKDWINFFELTLAMCHYALGSVRAWFANPIHRDLFACLLMGLVGSWILIYGFCILVTL